MASLPALAAPSLLTDLLSSFVTDPNSQEGESVIHAGHYALFRTKDDRITDCLDGKDSAIDVLGFGRFSRATWRSACRATANAPAANRPRLIVLVNDWQYIEPAGDVKRENKQAADRSRSEYYRRTPVLPQYHLDELKRHGIPTDTVLNGGKDCWLFSENALRNELHPIVKEVQANEERARAVGIRRYFNENGEPIVEICDDEAGKLCLLHCGNTNCAGEVISLLGNLYRRGVRRFLNIYPSQCREPVSAGTRLAFRIFEWPDFMVTNAAVSVSMLNSGDPEVMTESFGREP